MAGEIGVRTEILTLEADRQGEPVSIYQSPDFSDDLPALIFRAARIPTEIVGTIGVRTLFIILACLYRDEFGGERLSERSGSES